MNCRSECQPRREGVARRIILILSILSLFPFFPFSSFSPFFPSRPLTPFSSFFDSGVGRSICRRRTHSIRRTRAARRVRPPLPLCPRVTFHLVQITCPRVNPSSSKGPLRPFLRVHVSPFTSFTCPRVIHLLLTSDRPRVIHLLLTSDRPRVIHLLLTSDRPRVIPLLLSPLGSLSRASASPRSAKVSFSPCRRC